jgi:hypothetical protein
MTCLEHLQHHIARRYRSGILCQHNARPNVIELLAQLKCKQEDPLPDEGPEVRAWVSWEP